mgnify:CR=1 FL=1
MKPAKIHCVFIRRMGSVPVFSVHGRYTSTAGDPYLEHLSVIENDEDIHLLFWYVMMEEGRDAFRNMPFPPQEKRDLRLLPIFL